MLEPFKKWISSRRRKPLDQLLAVEFDDREVRVRMLERVETASNQSFEWNNIRRVCFKDGGMFDSDRVFVSLREPDEVRTIPTEARGGAEFFGALCDKRYFPEHVWKRAVRETNGGMFCWPEE